MKKLIQLITFSAVVATFSLPVFAQQPTASPSPAATTAAQKEDPEAKAALYKRVTDNYKTNQPVAYEAAKEYLQKYPDDDPKIIQYLQNFVAKYDKAKTQVDFPKLITDKKYTEAFAVGKQMLATDPENLNVMMRLGYAGYQAAYAKNTAFNADAINYAKSAIQMIESGKTPASWEPFTKKEDALAYLNYALGYLNLETNKSEAIDYLVKAAQNEDIKKDPLTYSYLFYAYETGPYKKEVDAYEAVSSKPDTPEFKAALERLNPVTDRLIDAYARAVAYATDAKYAADKAKWMTRLTELYKFRHNGTDTGLNELITSVRTTPLASPTSAPSATAPATAPASTTTTTGTDGGDAATGATTTPTTNATGTTNTTNTTTTPATTTQPANTNTTTPNTTTPKTTTPKTTTPPSDAPKTTTPATQQPATKKP